jgi:hypothetical protein
MSKRQKRLQKLRQNPRNVSLDELRQVLEDYSFWLDLIVGGHHMLGHNLVNVSGNLGFRSTNPSKLFSLNNPLRQLMKSAA